MPGDLVPAFRQFKRDFDSVTAQWVVRGEETEASVGEARTGLRRYLAGCDGADRADRLRDVFAFWREAAARICPNGVAVRPVMSIASEARAADREWKGRAGR